MLAPMFEPNAIFVTASATPPIPIVYAADTLPSSTNAWKASKLAFNMSVLGI